MGDTEPVEGEGVRNTARVDGPAVQAGTIHGGVTIHHTPPPRRWYRDPAKTVLVVVTVIAATTAIVLYLLPYHAPGGDGPAGKYVDPEECKSLTWPGPATPGAPQQVHTKEGVADYAIIRQTPCWRAETPELSAPFTPETGITVLCSVNADNLTDTAGIPRYGWYLVADPAPPGHTLGWTPQWPFTAPVHAVPTCGPPIRSVPSPITIVVAALALFAAAFLIIVVWWRRVRRR